MRPYSSLLAARFRALLQYRAAALAGVVTQVFFGFVRVMVFRAFHEASAQPAPLSPAATTAYIWLGQAFLLLGMLGVDAELAALVRSGGVAHELVRPVDLHSAWFARVLAGRAAPTALRALPILALALVIGHLWLPASLAGAALTALSLVLALALGTALYTLVTISLLWTISGEGVARLLPPVAFMLSGMIVPLPLFPEALQPLLHALPFRGLLDVPSRIWLGVMPPDEIAPALLQQLAWTLVLVAAGRLLLARGVRRVVVQGG